MVKGKRVTIKNKLRFMVLSIIVLAIFVVSMIAVIIMLRIRTRSKNSIINERYDNVRDLLYEKTTIAELSINEYVRYNDMAASLAEMIYDNKDQYINKEIPMRGIDSPEVYSLQRSYDNMDVDKAKVKEEMSLLANLESIWEPMMKESGNFIATAYAGTESGFMISYDMNADKAEYSEDGEVYFNHKDRTWFLEAKKQGKLIFTDIEQDYFGRGLSLTCAKPFYHNGEFAGVVAMDILVSDLQKAIIDMDIDKNYDTDYAFLLNHNGDIIASPYINGTIVTFENINSPDSVFYDLREKIMSSDSDLEHSKGFYCVHSKIKSLDWILCLYIPEDIVLAPVNSLENIIRFIIYLFIAITIAAYVIVYWIVGIYSKKFTEPIENLEKDVKLISGGNLDYEAQVIGNDEISDLAISFNNMTKSLKNYINDLTSLTAEKERIGAELNVATHIQSSMLPSIFPAFPDDDKFDIYATMNPAKEVGGDFYDFFKIDDKHLAIVVADVSGKGVPAALFMVIGKTLIKDHTTLKTDLSSVFYEVNNILCESNSENLFITAFEGVVNLETGHFTYVNAGHELPFIYRKGEGYKPEQIKAGFVLAGMENMKFTCGDLYLNHGDRVFQYTDGVTEATNSNNELYGMERLEKALNENCDKAVTELLPAIKADIDKFVGDAPQFDDITMLGFEYK